ncbi:MAG TPA: ribonuclease J [Candidatus Paceibacterota bacterium]|nr:ribonuclease J [Candidatus Paceibacterota bacterium]
MIKQKKTEQTSSAARSSSPRRYSSPARTHRSEMPKTSAARTPVKAAAHSGELKDAVRFAALGGMEEIGRNCSFFEYKDEIVIIDAGIQFPEEATPGIDYIIPNASYIESKKKNVRGIILTHGHYDHIAAIHYLIEKFGNPIIYTSAFTKAIVEKRHEEFTNAPKLHFQIVAEGNKVKISENFEAEFFSVGHTIPESLGFVLKTPAGNMVSFGDFRLETDKNNKPQDTEIFEKIGEMGIHSAFIDATNAEFPGFTLSERVVEEEIENLIKNAKGRVIIASFASLVDRLLEIIKIADKLGRKVALNGRSMVSNINIAKNLGYLKEKSENVIPIEEINKYKDEKIVILTTGSQGESNAGLMRMVNGEHRIVRFKPTDTIIFSSSVVPGNERSIQSLQDNIARQVDEVYNSKLLDIHSSGHAKGDDVKLVLKLVKPKFVVPIHSYYYKRKAVIKLAKEAGIEKDHVIMLDNGQVAALTKDKFVITNETVPASYVMVDGLGVGDVEEVVLRDRVSLSKEGMVVIILTVQRHNGRLVKSPDIISRGFIYLKENREIVEEIRKRLRGIVGRIPSYQQIEVDYLKTLVRDQVGQYIYNKTKRRPMILPVIIEI